MLEIPRIVQFVQPPQYPVKIKTQKSGTTIRINLFEKNIGKEKGGGGCFPGTTSTERSLRYTTPTKAFLTAI